MAFRNFKQNGNTPMLDASMGLIYRVNILFSKVDAHAEVGDFDGWNILLDRIYCNLLYRNELDIKEEKDKVTGKVKITGVSLGEEDDKIYRYLTVEIFKAKANYYQALIKNPKDKVTMKSKWYRALLMKDIWLRKFMQQLKLYLKEIENSPGSSLFGR